MNKNGLIFVIEDDLEYGRILIAGFTQKNFSNVILFTDENECLKSMGRKPQAVVTGYHLKSMTGVEFIQKAKAIDPDFFAILLSGEFYEDFHKIGDRLVLYVDKLIIKGMDDMNELVDTLIYCRT